jgi:hypothetical protein
MIDYIKNLMRITRRKEKESFNPICKSGEEEFLMENPKEKVYTLTHARGILTNSMITLSILPSLYLILSVLIVVVLLFLQKKEGGVLIKPKLGLIRGIGIDMGIGLGLGKSLPLHTNKSNSLTIPSFYELPKINQTVFHIYTCLTSVSGLLIVTILFSVLKQRFKVPEYRDHSFKLYIMLFFGFTSNILNLAKSFTPYLESLSIKAFTQGIEEDIKIELSHLLFIGLIFFSILFSMYSISVLDLLRSNRGGNNHSTGNNSATANEDNWLHYKIVTLTYLCVFTLIYIIFILYDNKIFIFSGTLLQCYLEKHSNFVITFFPYFIHIINAVLMFSFYFELKYVNLALSQNLEVDYLFDDAEKHIF